MPTLNNERNIPMNPSANIGQEIGQDSNVSISVPSDVNQINIEDVKIEDEDYFQKWLGSSFNFYKDSKSMDIQSKEIDEILDKLEFNRAKCQITSPFEESHINNFFSFIWLSNTMISWRSIIFFKFNCYVSFSELSLLDPTPESTYNNQRKSIFGE